MDLRERQNQRLRERMAEAKAAGDTDRYYAILDESISLAHHRISQHAASIAAALADDVETWERILP